MPVEVDVDIKVNVYGEPSKTFAGNTGMVGGRMGGWGSQSQSQHFVEEIDNAFVRQNPKRLKKM